MKDLHEAFGYMKIRSIIEKRTKKDTYNDCQKGIILVVGRNVEILMGFLTYITN